VTKQGVIDKAEELKEICRQSHKYSQEFYEELLDEYAVHVWALKSIKDEYPWMQALKIQEKYDKIEARLSNITDEEFEEFIVLGDFLAVLLK